jgi:hypothetical protein
MDSFMDGQHDLLNNEPYNKEKTTTNWSGATVVMIVW